MSPLLTRNKLVFSDQKSQFLLGTKQAIIIWTFFSTTEMAEKISEKYVYNIG